MRLEKSEQIKVFKEKVWSTPYADSVFSKFIRQRDVVCRRCKKSKPLDCSHYWRRDMKGTRFDPRNCIALCRDCHTIWEKHQNSEYKEFMLRWLGEAEYQALEVRARTSMKMRDAVLGVMELFTGS